MVQAFGEIRRAAGLPEELTMVETAMAQELFLGFRLACTHDRNFSTACGGVVAPRRSEEVERVLGVRDLGVGDGRLRHVTQRSDEVARLGHRDEGVVLPVQDEERRGVGAHPGDR